jgi:hypothetical protein
LEERQSAEEETDPDPDESGSYPLIGTSFRDFPAEESFLGGRRVLQEQWRRS